MQIAIITGASSGLGAAFARAITTTYPELDEIWLIARRRERLEAFAAAHPERRFRILALDLSQEMSFVQLGETLQETRPQIRFLVNNAGFEHTGSFADVPVDAMDRMLEVNVLAATRLQRICTAYLAGDSATILTSSVLSFVPTPGQAVYAATKTYLYSLGRALREEYRSSRHGNVLVLCPGSMDTEMNPKDQNPNARRFPFLYVDVDHIAGTALRKAARDVAVYTPGWFYKAYRLLSRVLPQSFMLALVGRLYSKAS